MTVEIKSIEEQIEIIKRVVGDGRKQTATPLKPRKKLDKEEE